ncbi:methyl-accepting chemotaxis protein [Bacillus sp. S/N-304-OC-R1]|uniref:methyl-accepting chemotaxis protein n=1 Tax=Bacillus sp. S/N-304-OC-R1 TaxID=2758034 RepID=UPI001C8F08F2|nr:methyl-accepting chemotaxis protein [Bacillus sp. S/N-304-OC-R1]MBY0123309.1 methyl-accepting chemotaxis protein [Bacillus sp. S/N-304-OC-R1]
MKFKGFKIGTKFNLLMIGIILTLSITISLVAKYQIEKAMMNIYTDQVSMVSDIGYNWLDATYPGDWSIQNGILYKGDHKINSDYDLVEELGKITNGAVTIFQRDIRISTTVKENGNRTIGTKADPEIADIVLNKGEIHTGQTVLKGQTFLAMYKPIKNANGEIIGMWVVGPPIHSIKETVLSVLFMISIVLLISTVIAIVCSLLFTRTIVRPMKTINMQLKEIAEGEGDLTKELSVTSKDEIGDLASSFNKMLYNLRSMIQQISLTSEQIAASSEELTASAEQTTQATNQITTAIQEIAIGAEMQGQGAVESSKSMQVMTESIQQVAETTASVSEAAMETSKEANKGNESIQMIMKQMDIIHESVDASASVVNRLGEQSKEIGNITEVIMGIADQTNLLALNAAIEAARAGEQGRGFTVVADEVRNLAEQSKESATKIAGFIKQIQEDTLHAVSVMNKGTHEVAVGMEVVHKTSEGIQNILSSVEQVASQIQEASAVTEEMAASVEEVSASIEEMASISQVAASNTQNVASSSEEQLASIEEIASTSASLSKMAEDLQELVNKFKV